MASLFGGLAEGIETGQKMGLLAEQSKQKQQELALEKKKQSMEAFKTRKTYMDTVIGLKKNLISMPEDQWSEYIGTTIGLLSQTIDDPDLLAFGESIKTQAPLEAKTILEKTEKMLKDSAEGKEPDLADVMYVKSNVDEKANKFIDEKFGFDKAKYEAQAFTTALDILQKKTFHQEEVTAEDAKTLAEINNKYPEQLKQARLELIKLEKGQGDESTKSTDEIASALFNKPYSELSQTEKQQVLDRKQEMAVEVSAAREGIKIKKGAEATIADLDNTRLIVDTLDKLSGSLITATDAVEAAGQRASLTAGALSKTNETASTYRDQREQFTGVLSRSLGGEKGVLTDRDIARITKGLPQFGDTKKIRDFKMGTIRLLIDTAVESKRRLINNEPQSPRINERLNELFDKLEGKEAGASKLDKFMR